MAYSAVLSKFTSSSSLGGVVPLGWEWPGRLGQIYQAIGQGHVIRRLLIWQELELELWSQPPADREREREREEGGEREGGSGQY